MGTSLKQEKKSVLLFKWLYKEKDIIYKVYLLALLQGIMYIVVPLSIQGIITYIMAGSFSASLILLSTVTIMATVFIGFFQIWQMRISETLHQTIFGEVSLKMSHYLNENVDVVSRKINYFFEVITVQKSVGKILLDFSFSVISIFFGILILPAYSSWFLLFTILFGLTFYFIIVHYGKKGIQTNVETSDSKYDILGWLQTYDNKSTTLESEILISQYLNKRTKHYGILESQFKGILVFKISFVAILLFLGAFLVQIGELNIGQFIASEIIILLVINSIEKLVASLGTFYDIITAIYKIETIFKDDPKYSFIEGEDLVSETELPYYVHPYAKKIKTLLISICICIVVFLFLPWTQNVESMGKVTTLNPENRPQEITSRIGGRIEKWYIKEGDLVDKNDTIAFISEIKDEYFDPQLINRSESQIKAKESTMESYEQKINAVNSQIDAINNSLRLKISQSKNKILQSKMKVNTDSIEAHTQTMNLKVNDEQLKRFEELLTKGVISKTDFENRKIKLQDAVAKKNSSDNKFMASKNEFLNAEIELSSIQQEYNEKLMKAESDKYSVMSSLYEAEGSLTKLQNQLANYSLRQTYYYVLAPQDGYITKTNVQGIGEIIKEGEALCTIAPHNDEQAVELYISPIDLPLIHKGQRVQLIFDGWPSFVFSGWPGLSYGTFSAEIIGFDKVLSENGKFRILAQNKGDKWPDGIQIGGGVQGFSLLNNVPLGYEMWRKINGFPPEFYKSQIKEIKKSDGKK